MLSKFARDEESRGRRARHMHDVTCVLEMARLRAACASNSDTNSTHESTGHRVHARQSEGDKGLSMAGNKASLLCLLAKIIQSREACHS